MLIVEKTRVLSSGFKFDLFLTTMVYRALHRFKLAAPAILIAYQVYDILLHVFLPMCLLFLHRHIFLALTIPCMCAWFWHFFFVSIFLGMIKITRGGGGMLGEELLREEDPRDVRPRLHR